MSYYRGLFKVYDENGKFMDTVRIDGYYWSWGDLLTIYVDNFIKFAEWFDENNIMVEEYQGLEYADLQEWVYKYDCFREGWSEDNDDDDIEEEKPMP